MVTGGWGRGRGNGCFMDTVSHLPEENVRTSQQCECTECHGIVHLKEIKMVNFMVL